MYIVSIFYLLYHYNHMYYDNLYYNIINFLFIYYILFHCWYITFCYRVFVLTTSRLRSIFRDGKLEYMSRSCGDNNGVIDRIYVRHCYDDSWYELDYLLTIPRGCAVSLYNKFINDNSTLHELHKTMTSNRHNTKISYDYNFEKSVYNSTKYTTLFILLLSFFITFLILIKKGLIL